MNKSVRVLWCIQFFVAALACGDGNGSGKDGGSDTSAIRTPSGIEASRPLTNLSEGERTQLCVAATASLYSATTADRECVMEGIVNEVGLPGQVTCEEAKNDCLMSFIEIAEQKCSEQIMEAAACEATVGDAEECSFSTASLRAGLLPNVTCASDPDAKEASIADIYAANVWADTPECERYQHCRSTL